MEMFGTSAAAVRSLSAVFSAGAVVVFFDLCKLFHGRRIAFLAVGIIALAGAQLDVAQEARCYALLIFLAIGCADALVRIEKIGPTPRRLAALVGCLLLGFLTHYLMAGFAGALALYALLRMRGAGRLRALGAIISSGLLAAVIWGPSLLWQIRHLPGPTPSFLRESQSDRHLELTLRRVAGLPGEYLCGESTADEIFRQQTGGDQLLTDLLVALAVVTLILPIFRLRRRGDLLIWVLWMGGTIGIVVIADLLGSTTMSGYIRYTILGSPCVYAIVAGWDWPRRRVLRDALAWAVIVGLVILAAGRVIYGPEPKENWREAAQALDSRSGKNDLIVFFNQDPWLAPGIWYMCLHYYLPDSDRPWLLLREPPDRTLWRQLNSRDSLWLVGVHAETTGGLLLPGWRVEKVIPVSPDTTICRMVRPAM